MRSTPPPASSALASELRRVIPDASASPASAEVTPEEVRAAILRALDTARKRDPVVLGVERGALLIGTGLQPAVFKAALVALLAEEKVTSDRGFLRIAGHFPAETPETIRTATAVRAILLADPFNTPKLAEIAARIGGAAATVVSVVNRLTQEGEIVALRDGILLHRDAVASAREVAVKLGREKGEINPGEFRDALKTSRKYVIPLLERLEAEGVTARRGGTHVLK
jgi:selenocysteine-specific elongation factor